MQKSSGKPEIYERRMILRGTETAAEHTSCSCCSLNITPDCGLQHKASSSSSSDQRRAFCEYLCVFLYLID